PADPTIRAPGWKAPKTSWGAPDLGGQWSNATLTPLTRNPRLSAKTIQAQAQKSKLLEIRPDFAAAGGDVGGYNTFWIDPGTHIMEVNGEYRTSILTTPNGQPPKRKDGAPAGRGGGYRDIYDSYETRSLGERCIMGFGSNAGPPMFANG